MNVKTQKCSGCGILRLHDTNHWLIGERNGGGKLTFSSMTEKTLDEMGENAKIFCGENCATKFFLVEISKL